jgi:uncharacterized protein YbjT (DUF2867 family)
MIYVTAGGGHLGREIVDRLAQARQRVRALVTSVEEGRAIAGPNVDYWVGDRARPASYADSLAGSNVALLLTRNALDLVEKDAEFCSAARAAGMSRVVKISAFGASPNAEKGAKQVHGRSEAAVQRSGLEWTFLRPQFFMQNMIWFVDEIARTGAFSLPMGAGRVGMIDFRDLAAVAVKCLTDSGHEGRTYNLSGPELLSCEAIAATLSEALGRPVRYNNIAPDEFRLLLISMGQPAWHAEEMTVSYVGMSKGVSAVVSEDVRKILGRPATSFSQVARDYAHLFR